MRFEVERKGSNDTKRGVSIFPSDKRGFFMFEHPSYGDITLGKIGLLGLDVETIEGLEGGAVDIVDFFYQDSADDLRVQPIEDVQLVGEVRLPEWSFPVLARISEFLEMSPTEI